MTCTGSTSRISSSEAQNHTGPKDKPRIAWRKAAQALAIRALLLQEEERRGLTPDPLQMAPSRFETEDEALILALLDEALEIEPIAEEAVRAEWQKDPDRCRSAPRMDRPLPAIKIGCSTGVLHSMSSGAPM